MPDFTRPTPTFETITETVWVVQQNLDRQSHNFIGASATEEGVNGVVSRNGSLTKPFIVTKVMMERQSLRPIYGGGTLIENLWAEMDAIMERLMTGQQAEDGGDRFRAEELAWVLAIVTNAYDPDINRIRRETMERWNAAQEAAAEEEANFLKDQQQHQFDAAGVNGYEL